MDRLTIYHPEGRIKYSYSLHGVSSSLSDGPLGSYADFTSEDDGIISYCTKTCKWGSYGDWLGHRVPATSHSCYACLQEICFPTCKWSYSSGLGLTDHAQCCFKSSCLATSPSDSVPLSLTLKVSTPSLGDYCGRLALSFELAGLFSTFALNSLKRILRQFLHLYQLMQ